MALSGEPSPRPLTHDLLAAVIETLDARVDHVEVTDVRRGTFVATLALQSPHGATSVDSRPSDTIALALLLDAPLFASDEVLDEAGALVSGEADERVIDDAIDRFRAFLDDVDPREFETHEGPDEPDEPPL